MLQNCQKTQFQPLPRDRKQRNSVRKDDGEKVSRVIKYRNSTRKTKIHEVKNQRGDIQRFFSDTMKDFIFDSQAD